MRCSPAGERKETGFNFALRAGGATTAGWRPRQYRQILANLVGNALKFTEFGHILINVDGEIDGTGLARITLGIEDTGVGIPPEALAGLFTPFNQADATTTRRFGGTGLGLAITQRLVELMGGQLNVKSKPGEGSTFSCILTLPSASRPGQRGDCVCLNRPRHGRYFRDENSHRG